MKKTVFAAQVFGLIVMLPMVAVLELNRAPFNEKTVSESSPATENAVTAPPAKPVDKLNDEGQSLSMETFLLTTAR